MLINKKYISVKVNDEKLKIRNKGLAILLEMSNYLATSLTINGLFEGALSRILKHFDIEAGRIYLIKWDKAISQTCRPSRDGAPWPGTGQY